MRRTLTFFLYSVFVAALSWICFLRPVSDDFDRYIYEALVRGRYQDVQSIYPIVKHENPRAEASSVLDSPGHLAQLEPLYAIRPLYLEIIALVARAGVSIPRAITLVSALSLFGIGMVLLGWTHRPAYCALLMATPAIVLLGRIGTPDALSSLLVLSSVWALVRQRLLPGVLLLLASIWVRTDNILLVFLVLVWLAAIGKLSLSHTAVFALLAAASVVFINHFSGNYGWGVLFRYSFIGGRYPADIAPQVSWRDYFRTLARGLGQVGGQELTLMDAHRCGCVAVVTPVFPGPSAIDSSCLCCDRALSAFPTPEDRYFSWAYLIVGALFIEAIDHSPRFAGATRY